MADMTGLAYLMSLIGGGAKGGYEGYSAGIQDQKDAANLAERKRQFDEGQFTDITPEMGARLNMPAGRTRNTILPALLNASEKEATRRATEKANEAGAAALEKAATQFPEGGRTSEPSLDLGENPEAAGTTPPPQQPNRYLQMFADLQRADTKAEPLLNRWMQQTLAAKKPGQSDFFAPHYLQQPDGTWVAVSGSKTTGEPTKVVDTGVKGLTSRSVLDTAITEFQRNPTTENWQRLNLLARPTSIAPGGNAASTPALAGMQQPGGAPAPTGGVGPGNPIVASVPAQPPNDALQDISTAESAAAQLKQVVQALKSGQLSGVLGGIGKNPQGAINRTTEKYLGYGLDDSQRKALGTMAMQLQTVKHALIGATRTMYELKDIAAAVPDERSLLSGDTAEQILPKLEALLGNLESSVAARRNAMGTTNFRTPAPFQPPAAATQGNVIRYGRDANGRLVPLK